MAESPVVAARPPAWRRIPRVVVVVTIAASVVLGAGGVMVGRVLAPHAAEPTVKVAPVSRDATGDPIVRPERLELPR
jgi:hypothetical protein